jgi:small subunit ribosomal protein S6
MSESRQYELVYVISPEVGEDGVSELHTQVETIVSDLGGRIEKTENWGRRRLAYEIGKHRDGTYVVDLIEASGEIVKELDRKLNVLDSVLRHLVVRVDEDLRKADRARQRRQTRRQRRRGSSAVVPTAAPEAPAAPSPPEGSTLAEPLAPDVVETGVAPDKVEVQE